MLTTKQQSFVHSVINGQNIFLTGKAGTGKSYALLKAMSFLKDQKKNVMCLAPTGVAANAIDGQTIHSAFQLSPFGVLDYEACKYWKTERRKMMQKVDVFIIDEISMVRADILDAINWSLIKNGCGPLKNKQVIFVGDMKQLPPPMDDNTASVMHQSYAGCTFTYAEVFSKMNVDIVELDEVVRQTDPEFISALNEVREGRKSEYFRRFLNAKNNGVILAPHNSTVQRHNLQGLNSVAGELFTYKADIEGNAKLQDFSLEGEVNVREGCKVMYLVNSKNNNLFNGAIGIFRMKDGNPMIEVDNNLFPLDAVTVTKKEYVLAGDRLELREVGSITQIPIKLAYALTIHKAQGLTFDEITIDLTQPCFQQGQLYVALSRVRTPQGLSIIADR